MKTLFQPSAIQHFTPEEVADVRDRNPDCWVTERVTESAAALIPVPKSDHNSNTELRSMPGMTPDLLDGRSIRTPKGEHDAEADRDR